MVRIRPWLPPVVAVLWLGTLELACSPKGSLAVGLAVLALTVALGIESVMLWVRRGSRAQKGLTVLVGGLALIAGALDVGVYTVTGAEHLLITSDDAAAKLPTGGAADAVCRGCKTLWHDQHYWLLGQPRDEWLTCLYAIPELPIGRELVPRDFTAYARLVDPDGPKHGPRQGVFLSWQFPRQRFALVRLTPGSAIPVEVEVAVETTRVPGAGIAPVYPFFDSPGYGWSSRWMSYRNLLAYGFGKSPHCRTDLQDDPYFLVVRGERDAARQRLASLPPARRAFVEHKLAAPPPAAPSDDGVAAEPEGE